MNGDKRKKRTAGLLVLVMVIAVAVGALVGKPLMGWISNPEGFRSWVEAKGWSSRLVFLGMVIFQVILAFIPGEPFEIAAGYAFGAVEGTLLCLAAAALGSALVVLLVRRFGVKLVEVFFCREKILSLRFLQDSKRLNLLLFIVFLIPGTPKDLLCYFVGLTDIRIRDWLLISFFARIPSVITSTIGGNALGEKNYVFAAAVFAATLLISIIGILLYRHICRKENEGLPLANNKKRSDHPEETY